ncbi:pre-mRNA-splicing factor prp46 [Mortierella sp. NVP41]|nr:pre-mRNA-splicing factor prp46 [Mortierella sp. NVP41]
MGQSVAVEPGNSWFATGAGDRIIKIWDLASRRLKLSLTGDIGQVIRHYHGHLSGVHALAIHPTLDVLVTSGRDATARVITSSMDSTVRLWDLAAGKTMATLIHHKKSVRAMALHPTEFTFATASPGNIKHWKCPEGQFMRNFEGPGGVTGGGTVNANNVMFTGADNGAMGFWDWKLGRQFQRLDLLVQPGSLDSEAGIFCAEFDNTGLCLITEEADKTKQDLEGGDQAAYALDVHAFGVKIYRLLRLRRVKLDEAFLNGIMPDMIHHDDKNYNCKDKLGSGGFGTVYLADLNGRKVALKVSHYGHGRKERVRKELLKKEITIHSTLYHPYIVEIRDAFRIDELSLEAVMIREWKERGSKMLSETKATPMMAQLVEAICYLHDRGLVHHDLKTGQRARGRPRDREGEAPGLKLGGISASAAEVINDALNPDENARVDIHTLKGYKFFQGQVSREVVKKRPLEDPAAGDHPGKRLSIASSSATSLGDGNPSQRWPVQLSPSPMTSPDVENKSDESVWFENSMLDVPASDEEEDSSDIADDRSNPPVDDDEEEEVGEEEREGEVSATQELSES